MHSQSVQKIQYTAGNKSHALTSIKIMVMVIKGNYKH